MPSLINSDTAAGRGVRTGVQSLIGLFTTVALAIWAVPGVPDAVLNSVTANLSSFLFGIGLPSAVIGVVSYLWNVLRKDVRNS